MKKSGTKRALFLSVLSVVLCMAMLMGSTFAWFTDSVSTGVNKIVAGNLDVEVYTGDELTKKVGTDTKLFDGIIWEPGAVAYENFKVVNEGTLALNYLFSLNAYAFNTVDGGKSLKDVVKIAVVEDRTFKQADGREAVLLAAEGKFGAFDGYAYEGYLETSNSSKEFAVVLYWEPSAQDNDYNLNNGKTADNGTDPLYLEIGMSLTATQRVYEYDSFGNTYDEAACSNVVATEAELRAAVEAGGYIRLGNDIALSEELYLLNVPALVIDGNGFAITAADDFKMNLEGQYQLVKVQSSNPVTLQNIKLEHKALETERAYHTLDIYGSPAVTLRNVTLVRNVESTKGGAAMVINGSAVTVTDSFAVIIGGSAWYGVNVDAKNGAAVLDLTNAAVTYSGERVFAYAENGGTILYDAGKYIRTDGEGGSYAISPAAASVGGTPYASLTDAIAAAGEGGTVSVSAGTYSEPLTITTANVTISGADGTVFTDKVSVNAAGVTLENIRFEVPMTATDQPAPIKTSDQNLTLKDCEVIRTTQTAQPYGWLVDVGTGVLTAKNTTFVAPYDSASAFSDSPSTIRAQGGVDLDGCTIATDGYGFFSQWVTTGSIKNTTFTGVDGRPTLGVFNSTLLNGLVMDGCTFIMGENSTVAAGNFTIKNSTFDLTQVPENGAGNAISVYSENGAVVLENNTIQFGKDTQRGINLTWADWASGEHDAAQVTIKGNVFEGTGSCAIRITNAWTNVPTDPYPDNTFNGNAVVVEQP